MWFENLTGFNEQSPDQVRTNLEVTGNIMTSKINTLVGGGVFGNDTGWILSAIRRATGLFANSGLDVSVVSYGHSNALVCK